MFGNDDMKEILKRILDGDEAALESWYQQHVDGLYAFVYYRVGKDPSAAEDITQETFLLAFDHLTDYDPGRGSMTAWLCLQSRNIIRSHLAVGRRNRDLVERWDRVDETLTRLFAALDSELLSDEILERCETQDLVNMTIAHLPEKYRTALSRKYVHGESMAQLAAALNLSEQATKSLLARARRAFRATFETLSHTVFSTPRETEATS